MSQDLAVYDIQKPYSSNYDLAPAPADVAIAPIPGSWTLAKTAIASPLGVAAGPLLNGAWCQYYASLGFDLVTYKTVRSRTRESYPLPNLQPLELEAPLFEGGASVPVAKKMSGSWAVSFGMPSKDPEYWRRDVEETRRELPDHVRLSVSVVGTSEPGQTLEELADDYAQCAKWAVECGADFVEANFSCPNVCTPDGQLYQHPRDSAIVAATIQKQCDGKPLLIKIGHVPDQSQTDAFVSAMAGHCQALVMTNGIAAYVLSENGECMFDGQMRGVAGDAIRAASIAQTKRFDRSIQRHNAEFEIVGVGGIANANHVKDFLDAGAASVQLATAVMTDPSCGLTIRQEW